jgi:hypothetical protein
MGASQTNNKTNQQQQTQVRESLRVPVLDPDRGQGDRPQRHAAEMPQGQGDRIGRNFSIYEKMSPKSKLNFGTF